jgi:hypothetical protein
MGYKRNDLEKNLKEVLKSNGLSLFYKEPCINYSGNLIGEKIPYSERIAEYLLEHKFKDFEKEPRIKRITRNTSYDSGHKGIQPDDKKTNREEEWIAKSMFDEQYKLIGKIIDYQTPLKNKRTDEAGKIDLLAQPNPDELLLIELKKKDSKETLLRCMLEIYTYYKIVDHDKLRADFQKKGIQENSKIIPVVAIFKGGEQHKQMLDKKYSNVVKLMKELGVKAVLLSYVGEKQKIGSNKPDIVKVESSGIDGLDP